MNDSIRRYLIQQMCEIIAQHWQDTHRVLIHPSELACWAITDLGRWYYEAIGVNPPTVPCTGAMSGD